MESETILDQVFHSRLPRIRGHPPRGVPPVSVTLIPARTTNVDTSHPTGLTSALNDPRAQTIRVIFSRGAAIFSHPISAHPHTASSSLIPLYSASLHCQNNITICIPPHPIPRESIPPESILSRWSTSLQPSSQRPASACSGRPRRSVDVAPVQGHVGANPNKTLSP